MKPSTTDCRKWHNESAERKAHARRPTMTTADTQAVVTPADSRTGDIEWVPFKSVRDAARRLTVVQKYYLCSERQKLV